jgi:hypothetical protein
MLSLLIWSLFNDINISRLNELYYFFILFFHITKQIMRIWWTTHSIEERHTFICWLPLLKICSSNCVVRTCREERKRAYLFLHPSTNRKFVISIKIKNWILCHMLYFIYLSASSMYSDWISGCSLKPQKKTRAKQKPTALSYTTPAPTEHISKQTKPQEKSTAEQGSIQGIKNTD